MTSIRAPVRARSGTMVSPGSIPNYSNYPTSPTLPTGILVPARAIPIPSTNSPMNSFTSKPKPRRPSLPNMSASTSSIPTHKSISQTTHLLPSKEPSTLRSPRSLSRLSVDGGRPPSQIARPSTSLARPSSASSPRLHTSPRMAATGRFGDSSTTPSKASSIPSLAATAIAASVSTTATTATKPAPKSQKSTGIKPPFIVTKPSSLNSSNSGNTGGSQKNNNSVSINSSSSTSSASSSSSLPPIAPSPSLPPASSSCLQTPQTGGSGLMSISTSTPSSKSTIPSHASHSTPATEQNKKDANTLARSKNRLHAGIDSACFMTRSGSSESASSSPSPPSSATSTPTLAVSATMTPGIAPRTSSSKRSPTLTLESTSTGPKSPGAPSPTSVHKPNKAEMANPSRPRAGSISVPGASILKKPTLSMSTMDTSSTGAVSPTTLTVTTPTTPSPLRTTLSTEFPQEPKRTGATSKSEASLTCQCPPPLEFPENVKREMKRDEEEHRQRECGLYAKIIELQIEVANLKSEKELLTRVVSRRDKMLLELQVQLQAMEFVCRENEIKVDVDMCPDEAIENWSFKESDEVYQRIILTTQELLRNGSRCLEEGVTVRTQSRPRTRITSSSSSVLDYRTKNVAGLNVAEPHSAQDQNMDLLFKKTSRPGTLKFDMQTLLRSEQEFHDSQSKASKTLDLAQVNLAMERGPRRALDIGDDRSGLFRNTSTREEEEDDDDDEGQESEFEELGEDMIKYVELQSSMTPRQSRSSSFSKPNMPSLTPDMSTAVLMKNMWGSRRNTRTTPIQHSTHGHFSPTSRSRSRLSHRGSSSSSLSSSSNSILEDYYYRPCEQPPANVGLGLSMGSPVHPHFSQPHFHHLMSAPPMGAMPPPLPHVPMSRHPMSSPAFSYAGSYFDHPGPPMMVRSATSQSGPTTVLPPPMMPLPPLPAGRPHYSYRDHTKTKLLESRRPTHGRTCSHGFAIENVGQFLKRKTYGKTLAREIIYRGHRRRDSV